MDWQCTLQTETEYSRRCKWMMHTFEPCGAGGTNLKPSPLTLTIDHFTIIRHNIVRWHCLSKCILGLYFNIVLWVYFEHCIGPERLSFIYSDGTWLPSNTGLALQHQYHVWRGAGNGHEQAADDQQCSFSCGSQTHMAMSKITTHNDALEQDHISALNNYDHKTIKREVVTMNEH